MSVNLLDTSNWLPLDGLAPGFDANKAPTVQDLAGQQFSVSGDGGPMTFSFDDEEVQWLPPVTPEHPPMRPSW